MSMPNCIAIPMVVLYSMLWFLFYRNKKYLSSLKGMDGVLKVNVLDVCFERPSLDVGLPVYLHTLQVPKVQHSGGGDWQRHHALHVIFSVAAAGHSHTIREGNTMNFNNGSSSKRE